jgi:hypothetical protein
VRAFAAITVAAIAGFVTKGAQAEPAARLVYLRGKGTESCPDEVDVRNAVQQRLGYDPFNQYAASTMFAEVSADPGGNGFVASLKLVDADNAVRGDRQLKTAGACRELMDAMALTMSIAIDPMSITRNGPPPDAPPPERPVQDTPRPPDDAPANPPPEPDKPVAEKPKQAATYSLSLTPYVSLGSAPSLAVGGALGGDVRFWRLQAGVEARGELPASAEADAQLGRVKSSLIGGTIFGGLREGPAFLGLVGSLGRLSATSTDTASSNDRSALFLQAGLRVGASFRLTDRFELRARGDMFLNLIRNTLTISGQNAYQYPAVAGDLGIGFAVRFL